MQLPFEEVIKVLVGEVFNRRNSIFVMFVFISLSLLFVGTVWPKRFTTFSIVIADTSNILQPLMEGTAETTRLTDNIRNARETIFGEKIMAQLLDEAGWLKANPSDIEQEKIKEELKKQISITGIGKNLIRFQYHDVKAMRAYITTKRMAELFIEEGERSKINESQAAYDFIENQVNQYLQKLTEVEERLRKFRSDNPDARAGLEGEVTNRINRLTTDMQKTRMELHETKIRRDSLREQLTGEASITISQSREGQFRSKIADLQAKLEALRLDYKETYPDIVRIKHQIADLRKTMNDEIKQWEEARQNTRGSGTVYIDETIKQSPLYQQLRTEASSTETRVATLHGRINEMTKMLEKEYERAKRIHDGEAALSKLTRDYQVNQEIYQDLLRRMERARVSRNLDQQNQGLTFKIQEPAKIPLIPNGIRFIHFALAGIVLGIALPIGLIYLILQVDPRIRFSQIISEELQVPVLAEITALSNLSEDRNTKLNLLILATGVVMVFIIYGYVGWLKYTGQL